MTRLRGLGRRLRPTLLFTAIPFALLMNSSQVHMTLQVERDGSAHRLIAVDTSPYFRGDVARWVGDVQAGHAWDRTWRKNTGTTYSYVRDYRTQVLNHDFVNGHLTVEDVFQAPLSLFTTYTWREEVSFGYLYDTDRAAAGATGANLVYEVAMPGVVTDATVVESKSSADEKKVKPQAHAQPARPPVAVAPLFVSPAAAQEMPAAAPGAAPAAPAAGGATPPAGPAPAPQPATAPAAPAPAPQPATPPAASPATAPSATPGAAAPAGAAPAGGAPAATPGRDPGPGAATATEAGAPKGKMSSVEFDGNKAIFKLMASQPTLTLNVVSRRVRWGYLVLVLYVLAFAAYQLLAGLKRAARRKPRKI